MTDDPRLAERMKRLSGSKTLSSAVRDRHREMIRSHLYEQAIILPRRKGREPWSATVVLVAATLAVAAGVVVLLLAASGSEPPMLDEQIVDPAVSALESEALADDRLSNLQDLIEAGSSPPSVAKAQDEAYLAVQGLGPTHPFARRYQRLVLGARRAEKGLDSNYSYEGQVRWADGEIYLSSMPSGDLLTIEPKGLGYLLSVSGQWVTDRSGDNRWYVTGPDADGETSVFEVQIVGDGVRAQLLAGPVATGAIEQSDNVDGDETASMFERPDDTVVARQTATTSGSGADATTSSRPTTTRPSTTILRSTTTRSTTTKPSSTSISTSTTRSPTTTLPPTTARSTTTTTRPTTTTTRPTTSTTRPPTTTSTTTTVPPTTTRPTTTLPPTTARPTTTVCNGDDAAPLAATEECDD
ncbi:MAG: hypothetical protein ACRBK7_10920 [Acidimicrobiales bacterium]